MLRILLAVGRIELQESIQAAVQTDEEIEIVGLARNGAEAIALAKKLRPDLVALGTNLQKPDGLETAKEIMIEAPAPIVLVASLAEVQPTQLSVSALAAGALAVIPAPVPQNGKVGDASAVKFLSTLKAMSQVKVVRRWRGRQAPNPGAAGKSRKREAVARIVAIAASTGGPAVIRTILSQLPSGYPVPILVVLHLSSGFAASVARWLGDATPLTVKIAEDGERLEPSTVYLAPDDRHLGAAGHSRIRVTDAPPIEGFRPSATYLFGSVARAFGPDALAIILTGMGSDGIEGLRSLRISGGHVIAQDEASCVVFGMPKAAIDAGLAHYCLSPDRIVPVMNDLVAGGRREK